MFYEPFEIQQDLDAWVLEQVEPPRTYLGMSQIHRSEDQLLAILQGNPWKPRRDHEIRFRLGFVFEDEVMRRLWEKGMLPAEVWENDFNNEVVATFDERFRGHIDGYLCDGSLLEIKSTVQDDLVRIINGKGIPPRHFEQVQMYLHHGGFERASVIYIARDSGQTYVKVLRPVKPAIRNLNAKAQRVLKRFDQLQSEAREAA